MQVTEVRIKLMEDPGERLKAFCSVTFDNCFVVRDLKIIEGSSGPFVAMPSRKLTSHCSQCGTKNHLRANFCNHCGKQLSQSRSNVDSDGRMKLYADIAHPINSSCREMIQEQVIQEFHEELERAKKPGYVSRYDDFDIDVDEEHREPPQKKLTEKRVDQAHDKRGTHVEGPGGDFSPNRPSNPTSKPSMGAKDSFGAGIFGDET